MMGEPSVEGFRELAEATREATDWPYAVLIPANDLLALCDLAEAAAPPEGPPGYWTPEVAERINKALDDHRAGKSVPFRPAPPEGPGDLDALVAALEHANVVIGELRARLDAAPSVLSVEVAARIFHAMDCGPNHALGDLNPPRHEPNSDQMYWCDHMAHRFVHDLAAIAATE